MCPAGVMLQTVTPGSLLSRQVSPRNTSQLGGTLGLSAGTAGSLMCGSRWARRRPAPVTLTRLTEATYISNDVQFGSRLVPVSPPGLSWAPPPGAATPGVRLDFEPDVDQRGSK